MKKLAFLSAGAAVVVALVFATSVLAGSPGQLGGGDNYVAKNVTTNGSYSDSTAATCGEIVQYSMQLTNTQWGALDNVTLQVSLPSGGGTSTATATTSLGGNSGTSDTTKVTLSGSNAKQSLVNGTTKLYDDGGNVIKMLPNTIVSSGVNVGTIEGSTTKFVNFRAKVKCEVSPKEIQVCELATKQIVTIYEKDYDSSKYSKNLEDCATKYIHVCELATKQIVKIDEDKFDASKYSKNLSDCEEPGEVTVCEIETKNVVTIKEDEFDSSKYTKDLSVCEETPVTPPAELPKTGAGQMIGLFSAVSVAGAVAHRMFSRRFIRG